MLLALFLPLFCFFCAVCVSSAEQRSLGADKCYSASFIVFCQNTAFSVQYAVRVIIAVLLLCFSSVGSVHLRFLCSCMVCSLCPFCVPLFSLQLGNAATLAAHTGGLCGHNDPLLQEHPYLNNQCMLNLEIAISIISHEEIMMATEQQNISI